MYTQRMLANELITNEVKNSAGTEQEFSRISINDRKTEFALKGETPGAPHRLSISHAEIGTGSAKRRRSLVRVDKTVTGVDGTPVVVSCYMVADIPIGNLATFAEPTNAVANLLSFCASLGATTTILYDGTGNGASTLINGTL